MTFFKGLITTFFFLVAFLIPRVADLHALDHLSEDDNSVLCELCDIVYHSQQFDLFLDFNYYKEDQLLNRSNPIVIYGYYDSPLGKIVSPNSTYNRPPPLS